MRETPSSKAPNGNDGRAGTHAPNRHTFALASGRRTYACFRTRELVQHLWNACGVCMMCGSAVLPDEGSPVRWTWDRPLIDAIRGFISKVPADILPENAIESIRPFEQTATPQAIDEMLDSLSKTEGVIALFMTTRLAALCRIDPKAASRLMEKLKDLAWRQACWKDLSEEALVHLAEAILDAQRVTRGEATRHLPYVLLEAAISTKSSPSRSGVLVDLLVMASVSDSTVVALKTLLRHPELPSLRKALLASRDHLVELRRHAPPVIHARLGHVLSVLSSL